MFMGRIKACKLLSYVHVSPPLSYRSTHTSRKKFTYAHVYTNTPPIYVRGKKI